MRDVAIVAFAQVPNLRQTGARDEVEMVLDVVNAARAEAGLHKDEIGFTVSGSCDFLAGRPFAFVMALDGAGPYPPIAESHVEMDGAWALYEAWVRLQHGDIDTALIYCFGNPSAGDLPDVMVMQLDPYTVAPLWPDAISMAALQAQALLDTGRYNERNFAQVAADNRRRGKSNPYAQVTGDFTVDELLRAPYLVSPLRRHDCSPISDGACAIVLAAGDKARACTERPAWIRGIDHRIDAHPIGGRDITVSPSA
ncbi:MAG: lipid-transfer protein, partial [Myxococcota bacterium]